MPLSPAGCPTACGGGRTKRLCATGGLSTSVLFAGCPTACGGGRTKRLGATGGLSTSVLFAGCPTACGGGRTKRLGATGGLSTSVLFAGCPTACGGGRTKRLGATGGLSTSVLFALDAPSVPRSPALYAPRRGSGGGLLLTLAAPSSRSEGWGTPPIDNADMRPLSRPPAAGAR